MRRTFSPDYKVAAVKLVAEQGYSVAQACSELGIGETALRRWIKQVQAEKQGYVLPGTKPLSPEQQRIRELEQRIKILEEDKEILKKRLPRFLCHSSATLPSGKGIKIVWNKTGLCAIFAFRTNLLCPEKAAGEAQ
ncbi:transposase [Avibacterium paragallinarum]|uniref:transposase n=1 Tax=Avibacterium paragallinarum TaxID=728 RepID=UPI003985C7FE